MSSQMWVSCRCFLMCSNSQISLNKYGRYAHCIVHVQLKVAINLIALLLLTLGTLRYERNFELDLLSEYNDTYNMVIIGRNVKY